MGFRFVQKKMTLNDLERSKRSHGVTKTQFAMGATFGSC